MEDNLTSNIKMNEPLEKYCTYRIGGPAKCLFSAADADQIIAGLEAARENGFPFFILGGGSNVLFSDCGFDGLVLKMENSFIDPDGGEAAARLIVGAGTPLAVLVRYALENSLTGMEWAAGIPGTVGGAIRGNAGAFHEEMSENVAEVRALEIAETGIEKKTMTKSECKFSYRESVFKHNKNLVVVSAVVRLRKGNREEIKTVMGEYLAKKATTQPLEHQSAGSVFVNPPGFFAGKLIEDCGFKGKSVGGAQVSGKHSNFIVNRGGAKARDVLELIAQIKSAAKEKFNVEMKEEIEIV
jgi:UDP-N-acetylmuramate dehydrogenase